MKPFFVTGLPRSRTAWMANWLTTDKSLCYHDRPFESWLLDSDKRIGFAGPELVPQFPEIQKQFPEAPWLVVLRNAEEALVSFRAWAGNHVSGEENTIREFWRGREVELSRIATHSNVETVRFEDDLDNPLIAQNVWAHLLPGIEFDFGRWQLLIGLNVQQDLRKALGNVWHSEQSQLLQR